MLAPAPYPHLRYANCAPLPTEGPGLRSPTALPKPWAHIRPSPTGGPSAQFNSQDQNGRQSPRLPTPALGWLWQGQGSPAPNLECDPGMPSPHIVLRVVRAARHHLVDSSCSVAGNGRIPASELRKPRLRRALRGVLPGVGSPPGGCNNRMQFPGVSQGGCGVNAAPATHPQVPGAPFPLQASPLRTPSGTDGPEPSCLQTRRLPEGGCSGSFLLTVPTWGKSRGDIRQAQIQGQS